MNKQLRIRMVKELHSAIRSIIHSDNDITALVGLFYKGTDSMTDDELLVAYNKIAGEMKLDPLKKPALWILDADVNKDNVLMAHNIIVLAETDGTNAVVVGTSNGLFDVGQYAQWDHENLALKYDNIRFTSTYGGNDANIMRGNEGYYMNPDNEHDAESVEDALIEDYGENIIKILEDIDINQYMKEINTNE